jgi:CRP-like cAMP-binding protein
MLTIVEKVLFLQEVDSFEYTSTENLSHIAMITEEVSCSSGSTIYNEGEISDCMYLVIEGRVKLHRNNVKVMIAEPKGVFGSWALFDDEPRVVSATALEDSLLLKIDKEEFYELLADHSQITQGILKTFSKKLRSLLSGVRLNENLTQK